MEDLDKNIKSFLDIQQDVYLKYLAHSKTFDAYLNNELGLIGIDKQKHYFELLAEEKEAYNSVVEETYWGLKQLEIDPSSIKKYADIFYSIWEEIEKLDIA